MKTTKLHLEVLEARALLSASPLGDFAAPTPPPVHSELKYNFGGIEGSATTTQGFVKIYCAPGDPSNPGTGSQFGEGGWLNGDGATANKGTSNTIMFLERTAAGGDGGSGGFLFGNGGKGGDGANGGDGGWL